MGKQFLIWFAAALVGGLLLLTIGSYVQYGGPPPALTRLVLGSGSPLASAAAQKMLRASAPPPPPGITVLKRGDAVPATLRLPGLDGTPRTLAQYRGRRVVLNFWATWCHPCLEEMPFLARMQRKHAGSLQVIGVAMDKPAAVRAWLKHTPVDYPIVLGLAIQPDISIQFDDTRGLLPYSVLIGPDGHVEATHLGRLDGAIVKRWMHL